MQLKNSKLLAPPNVRMQKFNWAWCATMPGKPDVPEIKSSLTAETNRRKATYSVVDCVVWLGQAAVIPWIFCALFHPGFISTYAVNQGMELQQPNCVTPHLLIQPQPLHILSGGWKFKGWQLVQFPRPILAIKTLIVHASHWRTFSIEFHGHFWWKWTCVYIL